MTTTPDGPPRRRPRGDRPDHARRRLYEPHRHPAPAITTCSSAWGAPWGSRHGTQMTVA